MVTWSVLIVEDPLLRMLWTQKMTVSGLKRTDSWCENVLSRTETRRSPVTVGVQTHQPSWKQGSLPTPKPNFLTFGKYWSYFFLTLAGKRAGLFLLWKNEWKLEHWAAWGQYVWHQSVWWQWKTQFTFSVVKKKKKAQQNHWKVKFPEDIFWSPKVKEGSKGLLCSTLRLHILLRRQQWGFFMVKGFFWSEMESE